MPWIVAFPETLGLPGTGRQYLKIATLRRGLRNNLSGTDVM